MVALATCAVTACNWPVSRFIAIQDRELIAAMQAAVLERSSSSPSSGAGTPGAEALGGAAAGSALRQSPAVIAVLTTPHDSPMEELMRLAGISQEEHDRICARPQLQSAGAAV